MESEDGAECSGTVLVFLELGAAFWAEGLAGLCVRVRVVLVFCMFPEESADVGITADIADALTLPRFCVSRCFLLEVFVSCVIVSKTVFWIPRGATRSRCL